MNISSFFIGYGSFRCVTLPSMVLRVRLLQKSRAEILRNRQPRSTYASLETGSCSNKVLIASSAFATVAPKSLPPLTLSNIYKYFTKPTTSSKLVAEKIIQPYPSCSNWTVLELGASIVQYCMKLISMADGNVPSFPGCNFRSSALEGDK